MVAVERALIVSARWTLAGLALAPLLLAVSQPADPLVLFLAHLSLVVAFGVGLAVRVSPYVLNPWFDGQPWDVWMRRLATGMVLVALVTGAVALVTLASAAALRFHPSLQFLQLLSAVDIAWAGTAIVLGSRLRWGVRAAWVGGVALGVVCVATIARYLDAVGFTADNGWLVSGSDLMRYVIPFDMAAGLVAVVVLVMGARAYQPTEQASPQS